jgi:hypothetical protein
MGPTPWHHRRLDADVPMNNASRYSAKRGAGAWSVLLAVVVDIVWAAGLATQFVAARLGYHPHLGTPLFRASPAMKSWVMAAAVVCIVAAVVCLLVWRWRPAVIPLVVLAATATAIWHGPVYAPARFFSWHAAYRQIPGYGELFAEAWTIFAGVSVTLLLAIWRALRPEYSLASGGAPVVSREVNATKARDGQSKTVAQGLTTVPRLRTAGRRRIPVR